MFTRNITLKLKADSAREFTRLVDSEIVPLLRKQEGFRDVVTFIAPDRSEAVAISFWATRVDAEAYKRAGYPEVLKALSNVIEGTPEVQTFELSNSTFHKNAAIGA